MSTENFFVSRVNRCAIVRSLRKKKPFSPFEAILRSFGYTNYSQYLKSDLWINKRTEYSESGLPKYCLNCKSPKYRLHHLTYDNTGNENIALDLMPLCNDCHDHLHHRMRQERWVYTEAEALNLIQSFRPAYKVDTISDYIKKSIAGTNRKKNRPAKIGIPAYASDRANAIILEIEKLQRDEIQAVLGGTKRILARLKKH